MGTAEIAGIAAAASAAIVVPAGLAQWRSSKRDRHERIVQAAVRDAGADQPSTAKQALADADPAWLPDGIPMLAKADWLLDTPVSLDEIAITLEEEDANGATLVRAKKRAARLLPGSFSSYSQTIIEKVPGMAHLYDGIIYRPLEVRPAHGVLGLLFTKGHYFDTLDTTEVLAYEAELAGQKRFKRTSSYRKWLGDPFDLRRRSSSLGIITLTIRREGTKSGFYMHRRDGKKVLLGPNLVHVVPAGEFTPSDVGDGSFRADFDLWRNVMREYAEEFLDIEEAYGKGRTLDFERAMPYKQLNRGRRNGQLKIFAFGVALDPLTWKPELLTVCVIESKLFDSVFRGLVARDEEGVIISGPNERGIPFTDKCIGDYVDGSDTRFAGVSCLKLALQHREVLGL